MIKLGESVASICFIVITCVLWLQNGNHWGWLVGILFIWIFFNWLHQKAIYTQRLKELSKLAKNSKGKENDANK